MTDRTIIVSLADSVKTGETCLTNSWLPDKAATSAPLEYIERMNRTCRSHRDFRLMQGSWTEWQERLEKRKRVEVD